MANTETENSEAREPPITKSRLEINFIRLLEETQQMANGNKPKDWTFEKYVEWLLEKVPEMEKSPNTPNEQVLKHYKRQVDFLKGVLEAEKSPAAADSAAAAQLIPHGPATTADHSITQQIHHKTQAKTTNRLRQELLGLDPDSNTELRNRGGQMQLATDDFQTQLQSEEDRRKQLVEDMLVMTREWKEQSRVAGRIITKDVDMLDKSSRVADVNQTHLKVETQRLADYNKRACNFWIWIMIIIVCFTFIGMVVFIRIFPRRSG